MALDSVSVYGEPGIVRLDGLVDCSELPVLKVNGRDVPGSDYSDLVFMAPTIARVGAAEEPGMVDDLVFIGSQLEVKIDGAGPQYQVGELFHFTVYKNETDLVAGPLQANELGELPMTLSVPVGFANYWVQPEAVENTSRLLRRRVLRVE